eukprot:scaffold6322_cov59-Cylindrotheca_fusiformis.AAC.5
MDWTSVLDNTGEDDFLVPELLQERRSAPRLARLVSRTYHRPRARLDTDNGVCDGEDDSEAVEHRLWQLADIYSRDGEYSSAYNLKALYFLTINYILGVGCLGIPYAFARAGFLLCFTILLTVTAVSYITVLWVAESGVRLERRVMAIRNSASISETTHLLRQNGRHPHSETKGLNVDVERYEVIDLVGFYLGPFHTGIYQVSLMALMYIGLLAYTQVFCGALRTLITDIAASNNTSREDQSFHLTAGIPQLIFGAVVVPLSLMDLTEQLKIQSLMAAIRFAAIFIMVFGSLSALLKYNYGSNNNASTTGQTYASSEKYESTCEMSYIACFDGFGVAFSTALFSQLFQHSVPSLIRPFAACLDKKSKVSRVFAASLLTTFCLYVLLGISAASYFGKATLSSVNLNFANFTFGVDPITASPLLVLLSRLASNVVVLFPALDTLSVFPLIANTLGSNLMASSGPRFIKWIARHTLGYREILAKRGKQNENLSRETVEHNFNMEERTKLTQDATKVASRFWRLIAALPPLFGSLWATDLSFSLLLAGVAGLYVAFVAPSLLQLRSADQEITIYRGWYSSSLFVCPILAFATFALVIICIQIYDAWKKLTI